MSTKATLKRLPIGTRVRILPGIGLCGEGEVTRIFGMRGCGAQADVKLDATGHVVSLNATWLRKLPTRKATR